MRLKREYYKREDLYFSLLFGGGIYGWDGEYVQDPLCGDNGEGYLSPLLTNVITGEQFYTKRYSCSPERLASCLEMIRRQPMTDHILWPSDIVELKATQQDDCKLFVAQEYIPEPTPVKERHGDKAFLFPYGGYPSAVNGIRKLQQIDGLNWKNPEVRKIVTEIALAFESINRCGYFYTDIHLSRIYFHDDNSVCLDFSHLIFSIREAVQSSNVLFEVKQEEYPTEFADPSIVRGMRHQMDYHSQNFSLCALFFYLLLGQYPYDGRLLTGYSDDSEQAHYLKFRDYHKMPVFIFDPNDEQNALGAFYEEQQVIDLWDELPNCLKELFINTLRCENAERSVLVNNPTPSTWIRCFQEIGWYEGKRENQ